MTATLAIDHGRRSTFAEFLRQDRHDNEIGCLHDAAHLYVGTPIEGRTVLEIGSGRGLMTIYTALSGAARVVSLEPEMVGSRGGMIDLQRRRLEALGITNVDLVAADFNDWQPHCTFDVVLSRASINHLYPSMRNARWDRATFDRYVAVADRMRRMLAPDGVALITDASRYAFFTGTRRFGIRRPWNLARTGVDWRHHQTPGVWADIFRAAGFSRVSVRYPLPYRLRSLKGFVDTAAANFFLKGSFILRAARP